MSNGLGFSISSSKGGLDALCELANTNASNPPNLGNLTSGTSPNKINNLQAGKLGGFDNVIGERYALQTQVRKSLLEHYYSIPKEDRSNKPHKVCNCRRDFRPVLQGTVNGKKLYSLSNPAVYKHKETGNTFYGGLQTCASLYACPVCAPYVAEKRALEIRNAVSQWVKEGGICLFVTLTFPHYASDSMKSSITSLKSALTRFRSGKSYHNLMSDLGHVGLIRSIETTWGQANGYHPHSHEIWFVHPTAEFMPPLASGKQISNEALTALFDVYLKPDLFSKWAVACRSAGLSSPSYERGMVIKVAETEEQLQARLAEYFAKTGVEKSAWGVDDELTKLHSKRGKPDRYTPFDFLRQQFNPALTKKEKYRFRCLFVEYVEAFKNTAKIFWSRGLKAKFAIQDLTDEDIIEQQTENADLVYQVPKPIWVFVAGINDHRAELLLKAKNEQLDKVKAWLSSLLDTYADYLDVKFHLLEPSFQYILEKHFNEKVCPS